MLFPAMFPSAILSRRGYATFAAATCGVTPSSGKAAHRIVIVGAGAAGSSIGHQLLGSGRFQPHDISIVDPSQWHHYQSGWTLVGAGVKDKTLLRRLNSETVDKKIALYKVGVRQFEPKSNQIILADGTRLDYEQLIVAPGIEVKFDKVKGLPGLLADKHAPVGSVYSYVSRSREFIIVCKAFNLCCGSFWSFSLHQQDYCDKVYDIIQNTKNGRAVFTQPMGIVKCAGAPQKIMWLALDYWKKRNRYNHDASSPIHISFNTGLSQMFGVQRYSDTLERLRKERNVEGNFSRNLIAIEGDQAVFQTAAASTGKQGELVREKFDMLHAVPPMGPWSFVAQSPLANADGLVDVDSATLRHVKYPNVWSAGDASSLPTSKTAAAVTKQAPVLVHNLLQSVDDKTTDAVYKGYTSCPIPTEYGKLILAEFAYNGMPSET